MQCELEVWIDIKQPFRRRFGFVPAYGAVQRYYLAIYVGFAYRVVVDQIKRSYAASCKCLGSIPADSPYSENGDPCRRQALHCVAAQNKLRS